MRSSTGRPPALRGTFINSSSKKKSAKKTDEKKESKIPSYLMDLVHQYPDEIRTFARGPLGDMPRMELTRILQNRSSWDIERLAARHGKSEEFINQALDFLRIVRAI